MGARRYGISLLVFNSISHVWAQETKLRKEADLIHISKREGVAINSWR